MVHALYLELLMLCITLFAVLPFFFTTSIPPFRSLSPFCLLLCGLVWSGLTTAAAALSQQVAVTGIASARATGVAAPVPPSQPLFSYPCAAQPAVPLTLPFTEAPSAKDTWKIKASYATF